VPQSAYIETLQRKRDEVLTEVRKLRDDLSAINTAIAGKENQLRNLDDLLALEGAASPSEDGDSLKGQAEGSKFIDHAYRLLSDAAKPMHYRELADLLTRDHVFVPGQDPAANLLAHMSRDVRFGRTRSRGVYGLSDWPAVRAASRSTRSSRPRRRSAAR
jgi:hypothetical protein